MYTAVVLSGGSGKRTTLDINKTLYKIHNKQVLQYSIDVFQKDPDCNELIIVSSKLDYSEINNKYSSVAKIVVGGKERQQSVFNGVDVAINEHVLVHDGARPNINLDIVNNIKKYIDTYKAITCGVLLKDTIKKSNNGIIKETIDRTNLYIIQTPQFVCKSIYLDCYKKALSDNIILTDDVSLIEKYTNYEVKLVLGDYKNIKFTTVDDILLLEVLLK